MPFGSIIYSEAKKNNLSLVSGFCWRYDTIMRETMKRIHDGEIGEIRALQCNYNTGGLWMRKRESGWAMMKEKVSAA